MQTLICLLLICTNSKILSIDLRGNEGSELFVADNVSFGAMNVMYNE